MKKLLLALAFAFVGLSAFAAEDHGPPPAAATSITPSPRLVCKVDGILAVAFRDPSNLEQVIGGLQAAQAVTINGEHVCAMLSFSTAVTVKDNAKLGHIALPDKSEFDAWSVHAVLGENEMWFLWLEMTKDAHADDPPPGQIKL